MNQPVQRPRVQKEDDCKVVRGIEECGCSRLTLGEEKMIWESVNSFYRQKSFGRYYGGCGNQLHGGGG